MNKHTPGPWKIQNGSDVYTELGATNAAGIKADDDDGWQIATCCTGVTFANGELTELSLDEQKANARLCKAAPKLLEALKIAEDYITSNCFDDEYQPLEGEPLHTIRSVIAEATGEE